MSEAQEEEAMSAKALDMIALKNAAASYVLAADGYQNEEAGAEDELRQAMGMLLSEASRFQEKWPG